MVILRVMVVQMSALNTQGQRVDERELRHLVVKGKLAAESCGMHRRRQKDAKRRCLRPHHVFQAPFGAVIGRRQMLQRPNIL